MLFAFVHIEKTGGTTLIQLLRRNFFLRFVDVRPLAASSMGVVRPEDLRKYRLLNRRLNAIAGHAVRPALCPPDDGPVRYVTLLRDPARRYVSQFLYFVRIGLRRNDFAAYLAEESLWNFQTKKLAGTADLDAASAALDAMFAIGAIEEFDAFLLRLRHSLAPMPFDIRYVVRNTGREDARQAAELLERHGPEIAQRNALDRRLYEHALTRLIPDRSARYAGDMRGELARLAEQRQNFGMGPRDYADFAVRKLYYEPATGLLRWFGGLPSRGSY